MERVILDTRPSPSRQDREHTPAWLWAVGPLGVLLLAVVGVSFSIPGIELAVWWPAAGFSAWFALRAAPQHRWITVVAIFAVTTFANTLPGRDVLLSAGYGLANALEAAVIVVMLARRTRLIARRAHLLDRTTRRFVLDTANNALYFVLAAAVACVASAVVIGIAGSAFSTGFTPLTGLFVGASHCAAVLLIAPFALLPPPLATRLNTVEVLAQSLLLVAMIVLTFSPLTNLPGAFLIFGLFTWAVLRFPIRVVYPQALLTSLAVLTLTVLGHGAFAERVDSPLETAAVTVIFMTSLAVFSVLLSSARYETVAGAAAALELTRAQAAVERERAAALTERLELERQRQDFLATTSHELRTPITSILGYSELLHEADIHRPEGDWVEVIRRNAVRLSDLVEDLLSLGHDDAEPATLTPVELTATELAADVISTHNPMAMTRQVDLTHRIATEAVVLADRSDAVRALGNLVSNAVKFTPQGGTVLVEAAPDGAFVTFTVTDTGPGMSPATLARAFDRFYRAPDAETQNTPGTGLGLAIVRELAERNDGHVSLESPRQGGLRSTLVFRAADPPAAHAGD